MEARAARRIFTRTVRERILRSDAQFPHCAQELVRHGMAVRVKRRIFLPTKTVNAMISAWVYILTNYTNKVLFGGSTIDLRTRLWEHRTKQYPNSFTARYNSAKLIYYEGYRHVKHSRDREYYIEGKTRQWKIDLINTKNSDWNDLSQQFP